LHPDFSIIVPTCWKYVVQLHQKRNFIYMHPKQPFVARFYEWLLICKKNFWKVILPAKRRFVDSLGDCWIGPGVVQCLKTVELRSLESLSGKRGWWTSPSISWINTLFALLLKQCQFFSGGQNTNQSPKRPFLLRPGQFRSHLSRDFFSGFWLWLFWSIGLHGEGLESTSELVWHEMW
jgi:hypothetical protein